jgi:hypothetical protein
VRTRLPRLSALVLVTAVAIGAYLRLDQIGSQVLIDDEWHALHQVMHRLPSSMFLDFGFADYSIPLGILYWYVAQWTGLSELSMRMPMLVCGLVTLVALPLYVARRTSPSVAAVFALLLAVSPLLVIYSRMARPYAVTFLLGWAAHAAYQRYARPGGAHVGAGAAYASAATLAAWMHPIVAPFVVAPLLWGLARMRGESQAARTRAFLRLLALGLATGIAMCAVLLPPLVANAHSMTAKSGIDHPNIRTFVGVWYAWLGTPSTAVVIACLVLALAGSRDVWRALPEARTGLLGVGLVLLALLVTRPMFIYNPISCARYLLPFVALLLLSIAAGGVRVGVWATRRLRSPQEAAMAIALIPAVALAAQTPLRPMLSRPNSETLHFLYHFDFRPGRNPYPPYMAGIPLSRFWQDLASRPAQSVRIAAAPFYFESYDWDAPRWERISRQRVIPGFLTGLCVDERPGETPDTPAFRLRNAVHLADAGEIARNRIDLVVWQKPYTRVTQGRPSVVGADTAHCEAVLRARFGAPVYEDAVLAAFKPGQK